jgi:copper chaperone CopZ
MRQVEYKVTGMTCGGCAASVTRVLRRNKAITDIEVEQWENRVVVTYDEGQTNDQTIIETIERLGYKAEVKQ